ncbi:carboxypeptidase regulatory-like domain-containing protein [Paludisphaera borealis]|uniref:Regulatory protein BlaR1 n=1 Tax=Paludisphaera borealis TaxID=1387353 RepID=A0A1U7CXS7_9BACT|nr:carboxypeptidase regulatory-like domain-containing protein [Paludisphaera borealis]APW63706.1 Regulatory protein BlaR1 [Paludisphaera borealis]
MGYDLAIVTTPVAVFGLNWLVQSSVLLALGLAAGRLARGRGPALQSAVYRTTLAAVLVCPIASALLGAAGFDGFSLRLPAPEKPPPAPVISQPIVERVEEPPSPDIAFIPPSLVESPSPTADETEIDRVTAPAETEASEAVATPEVRWSWFTLANVAVIGLAAWGLGSLFLSLRLVVQQRRMRRLRACAAPADADAEALCRAVAARMDVAAPTVWRSPFLFSPCLDGLRRPAILLPDDVDENLHETFVHELAHLARRDGLWNLLRRLAAAVLWFQPLLWVLSRRLEATAEDVCDDYVVHFGADRARYAGLLLGFAGRALPPRSPSAVGMISLRSMLARRVVRILDTSRALSTRAGKKAILATLILGLASTTFAGLLGVGGQPPPPEAAEPAEAAPLEEEKSLAVDVPITGRIVDLEGRPVAGVVVKIGGVKIPKGDDLSAWIEGVKKGEPPWVVARLIDWDRKTPDVEGREAKTDADGRFRFDGLGMERVVGLSLRGETIAYTTLDVVSRKTGPIPAKGFANHNGARSETIYGADFIYTAAPGRAIEGVVKDAKTGKPLAGAGVWSDRFAGSDFVGIHSLKTTTDAHGRFRLNGFPRGKGNALHVVPNDDQPYFMREFDLPEPEGTDPIQVDVPVHKGIWIEGAITDRETGKPVPDAWLHYLPFLSNTFAQAAPEFGMGGGAHGAAHQDRYTSKADGSFRLVGLPGRAIVGAIEYQDKLVKLYMQGAGSESIAGMNKNGHFETYSNPVIAGKLWPTVMKEIDPPADATSFRVDLQPTAGDSVRVRIVAPDDRPVKPVKTIGRTSKGSYDRDDVDAAEAEVQHLHPGEERTTAFRSKERNLGKVVRVKKGDDAAGPVPVNLEPLAKLTGVVVDEDGATVSGARVRTDLLPSGDFASRLEETSTDEKGRFVVPDVPTGCEYAMVVESPGPNRTRKIAILKKAVVKPGETTDVGEIRFGNRDAQADQAAKPPAAGAPITGRIIDLEGRPVSGVVAKIESVSIPKGDDLTAWIEGVKIGSPPWVVAGVIDWDRKAPEVKGREATTDADGRFRFDGLGAERVVGLSLRGETTAYTLIDVVTRRIAPIPAKGFANQYGHGAQTVYGADFTYSAAPSRPVEGVVKDAKTGEPLADAGVWSYRFAGSDFVGTKSLKTRTDATGRFRLTGMPKGKGNTLLIVPNDEQPYLMREFELPDPAGSEPVKADVAVHKGVWIEGKLTEQETGKPIPNAWLHYLPFLSNTFAQATPEFGKDGNTDGVGYQDRYKSKPDGSFRLVGLPGRAIVGAKALLDDRELLYMQGAGSDKIAGMKPNGHFETYRNPVDPGKLWPTVMKEIDPPADAQTVHVDLQTTNGDSVKIRIVDSGGGPVSKLESQGRQSRGSYEAKPVETSDAEVAHLYPGEERTVMFRLKDRKLGKVVRVKKGNDAKGPVVVTLEPLATLIGRVVDADGVGVSGARVRPDLLPSGDFSARLAAVSTDEKGKFVVPDVPTGCDYGLAVDSLGAIKSMRFAFFEKAVVKPGETTDVGEIRFGKD